MNEEDVVAFRDGGRILRVAIPVTGVAVVAWVIGSIVATREALFAYLAAYAYVVSTALGALLFLMMCHAMNAGWPTLLRRLTEAMVETLPLLAVLFVPIALGMAAIYPWVHPESIADDRERRLVGLKAAYLNPGWFVGRAVIFFAIWILTGLLLRRWSRELDGRESPGAKHRLYVASGLLLPAVALALSFASFDWLMSLTPTWQSTMYPVYWFAGGFVGALALLTVLTGAADAAGLIRGINDSHYYALGRLLLAFTIFWAYAAFFQLMLIWIANKPEEAVYYVARIRGGWRVMSVILVITQFLVPFFVLLSYDLKRRRGPLVAIAAWILAAHYLDSHWLVMPAARPAGPPFGWLDIVALIAVAGVTLIYGVLRLRGVPMVPLHDPALPDALRYESL